MISGLVLAAGSGSRFGGTKQLAEVRGTPLVLHVLDALRGVVDELVVVTGHDAERVEAVLPADARAVRNERFRDGLATSLGAGLHALADASEAAVVLAADQPDVTRHDVRALVERFRATRARIVRLRYADGPGPALLSREIFAEAGHLHGDAGARVLMASHPDWVVEVDVDRPQPVDVDRPEDLPGNLKEAARPFPAARPPDSLPDGERLLEPPEDEPFELELDDPLEPPDALLVEPVEPEPEVPVPEPVDVEPAPVPPVEPDMPPPDVPDVVPDDAIELHSSSESPPPPTRSRMSDAQPLICS